MEQVIIYIFTGVLALSAGAVFGYLARQSIARKKADTIETTLQRKIAQVKKEAEDIIVKAEDKAARFIKETKKEIEEQRREIFETEKIVLSRERSLNEKTTKIEEQEKDFRDKVEKLKGIKTTLENMRQEAIANLERISKISQAGAKKELIENIEHEYQKEILEKIKKLEEEGDERYEKKAKEILAYAIQKFSLSQAQEITTTNVSIPSDEIKGRIIGKEGRNIKTLERLTGVEIIVDDTPETVLISGFDPVRRQIAKTSLEKLIRDGRIQPARIEEVVQATEKEIASQIKEAGEKTVFEVGILGLDPKIVQLLGRLRFRTSYGQNVLLHSMEVAFLSEAIASEIGADAKIAKKAGLLHDIGKAVDQQIQGSHVEIGIKILEKFKVEKEVVNAMKSHHEEYPYETLEAVIVQAADQISGARPGARKDTLENYLKRLEDLEKIALNFPGVEKCYAIQGGRELRIFVKPTEIDDLGAQKMAKEIADRIHDELNYPGEIKVVLIRENRVVEYAR